MRRSAFVALALVLTGCAASTKNAVAIEASDTACTVAKTDLTAGKTTFKVHNGGSDVTEVYVYAPGDVVVEEKENIGPGTSATFTANLAAGHYQVACKPGQKGDGIRTDIHVTGAGGASPQAADREVEVVAKDFAYTGVEALSVRQGETVTFELANHGSTEHEFEVLGPDGDAVGEVGPTKAGDDGHVTLTFAKAGTYTFRCGIADHEARGMKGTFTVA